MYHIFVCWIDFQNEISLYIQIATDGKDTPKTSIVISDCGQIVVEETPVVSTAASSVSVSSDPVDMFEEEPVAHHKEVARENDDEEHHAEEEDPEEAMKGMSETQKRLFKLRMKINQSRKLNKAEVFVSSASEIFSQLFSIFSSSGTARVQEKYRSEFREEEKIS